MFAIQVNINQPDYVKYAISIHFRLEQNKIITISLLLNCGMCMLTKKKFKKNGYFDQQSVSVTNEKKEKNI